MHILFWDIDGTLIRTSKAGLFAFAQAAEELWGKAVNFDNIMAAGMTDNYIARQIIESVLGREASCEEIDTLCRSYERLLPEHLAVRKGLVLPGVRDILSCLNANEDYRLLLLTGNSHDGAAVKLKYFELAGYFDFACSAFAGKYEKRVDIARQALSSVCLNWGDPSQHKIYVIGDTPHDIECGKAINAYTIGVATGAYSVAHLKDCLPWWEIESLPSPESFVDKITAARV